MAVLNLSHHPLAVVVVLLVIQPLVQSINIKSFQKLEESNKKPKRLILEEAVKTYQKNYNLNVTGKLDPSTIKQMAVPRCGVLDKKKKGLEYVFYNQKPKWPDSKKVLTYTFDSSVKSNKLKLLRRACSQALSGWKKYTHFTFKEVPQGSKADINIGIYSREHGDGAPFDGRDGVLAHAVAPPWGDFHFDADEAWSNNPKPTQTDTVGVALHELGHVLGLDHSLDPNSVMYASIDSGLAKRVPQSDDIKGIRALYK